MLSNHASLSQTGNLYYQVLKQSSTKPGLVPDILKMEFWTHMGRTANIIIKDIIQIFASMCKNMRILVMGRRYRERWKPKLVAFIATNPGHLLHFCYRSWQFFSVLLAEWAETLVEIRRSLADIRGTTK